MTQQLLTHLQMLDSESVEPTAHAIRVYVRFKDGTARTDKVFGDTPAEAYYDAYTHATGLRERPDVENAFLLGRDEPDGPSRWR